MVKWPSILWFLAALVSAGLIGQEEFRPLRGAYMGQVPRSEAEIFLPGKISTGRDEGSPVFFGKGHSFLWVAERGQGPELLLLEDRKGRWQPPREIRFWEDHLTICSVVLNFGSKKLYLAAAFDPDSAQNVKGATEPDFDLWSVSIQDGALSAPVSIGPPVNSTADEMWASSFDDGTLYFSRCHVDGGNKCDIFSSVPGAGGYRSPTQLPEPVNSNFNDCDSFISRDGSFLIFASDRPGGLGGTDIYWSRRSGDGSWKHPTALSPPINSKWDESSPSLTGDGSYMFFLSRRPARPRLPTGVPPAGSMPGNGSRDIYWTETAQLPFVE